MSATAPFSAERSPLPYGIRLNPFMVLASGTPFNVTTGTDLYGTSILNARPAFVSAATCPVLDDGFGEHRVHAAWHFQLRACARQTVIPINAYTGPGQFSFNLRISQNVRDRTAKGSGGQSGGGGGREGAAASEESDAADRAAVVDAAAVEAGARAAEAQLAAARNPALQPDAERQHPKSVQRREPQHSGGEPGFDTVRHVECAGGRSVWKQLRRSG